MCETDDKINDKRCFTSSARMTENDMWEDEENQKESMIDKGFLQYLYDDKGAKYLDTVNSVACVGHGEPRVNAAAVEALKTLSPAVPYQNTNAPVPSYEFKMRKTLPPHLDTFLFCDSGSEAVDLAVRLSRLWYAKNAGKVRFDPSVPCGFSSASSPHSFSYNQYGGEMGEKYNRYTSSPRGDLAVVEGSFHGCLNSVRDFSSRIPEDRVEGRYNFYHDRRVHVAPLPDMYRVTNSDKINGSESGIETAAVKRYLAVTQQMMHSIKTEGRELASFMCEPLLTIQGGIHPPGIWLQGIYRMIREMFPGVLCIADEVQSGMGRLGDHFWGFQKQGVVPDIVIAGKSLGNGFPFAMVVTSQAVADLLGPGKQMYYCNSVSNNIGNAVFDVITQDRLMEKAFATGKQLTALLSLLLKKHEYVGDVRGQGLIQAVEIVWSRTSKAHSREIADFLVHKLRRRGVVIIREGIHKNILIIMPPMTFDELDAAALVTKFDEVLYLVAHNFNSKLGNIPKPSSDLGGGSPNADGTGRPHHNNRTNNCPSNNFNMPGSLGGNSSSSNHYGSNAYNASDCQSNQAMDHSCTSPSSSNQQSSDERELVESLRMRRDIFSNIVFVEKPQNDINELHPAIDPYQDNHEEPKEKNIRNVDLMGNMELHPNELPRSGVVPTFSMGMVQPLMLNKPNSGYIANIFPNEDINMNCNN